MSTSLTKKTAPPLSINGYDYGYLKGDTVMWPRWGAAMAVTSEYCREAGLGTFGEPTEKGRDAMRTYESTLKT